MKLCEILIVNGHWSCDGTASVLQRLGIPYNLIIFCDYAFIHPFGPKYLSYFVYFVDEANIEASNRFKLIVKTN